MSEPTTFKRPELPKRFYQGATVAEVGDGYTVLLDGKTIRTPSRRPLVLPDEELASRIAGEWELQAERIDPSMMPMTRLANTVIDGVADNPSSVRADLAGYIETDLLFYRAPFPARLIERQRAVWDPIIKAAEAVLGTRFVLGEGVMHVAQPPASLDAFRRLADDYADPFTVAALHQMTTLTGSVLIAVAIAKGWIDLEAGWLAAHVDEDWNIEQWGEDAEAEARRTARYADMKVAADLLMIREGRRRPEV